MALIKREKLIFYKGKQYVDLRSYEVDSHISRKKTARVIVGDDFMDLTPAKLKKWTTIDPEPVQSIINAGQIYYLRSYEWKNPQKISEEIKRISLTS